jgi:hypothetical protein
MDIMKIKQDANGRLIVKHDLALFGLAFLIAFGTAAAISVVNAQWTFALIMTAVTLFSLILLSVRSTCAFDRAHGMVVLVRRSIFGTKIEEIQFRDLKTIRVETNVDSEGDTYRAILVLKTGKIVPLTGYFSSNYTVVNRTVDEIKAFLRGG